MLEATTAANLDAERQAAPKANAKANMATEKERSRAPKASSPQAQHQVQANIASATVAPTIALTNTDTLGTWNYP